MYTENPAKDVFLFASAVLSNQLARFAPKLYVNLTHQTGRGETEENALEIANYFIRCFQDYAEQINLSGAEFSGYLNGKSVLEYGPGDLLGVALLMYAHGAESVTCVDMFPLSSLSAKNIKVYKLILDSLGSVERQRAEGAFKDRGKPESGLRPEAVSYHVTRNGLSGARGVYDLIISRAVLEHVNDLEETMRDIQRGLKAGGISVHQVDLKSHGLDRYVAFDFLTWPSAIYRLMYNHKGFPNRWRVDKYKALAARAGLEIKKLRPTDQLSQEKVQCVYPKVAHEFRDLSLEDLSWLGFWMTLERA